MDVQLAQGRLLVFNRVSSQVSIRSMRWVTKEVLRASRGPFRIVPLDGKWLREAVSSHNFKGMLIEACQRSLMV